MLSGLPADVDGDARRKELSAHPGQQLPVAMHGPDEIRAERAAEPPNGLGFAPPGLRRRDNPVLSDAEQIELERPRSFGRPESNAAPDARKRKLQ